MGYSRSVKWKASVLLLMLGYLAGKAEAQPRWTVFGGGRIAVAPKDDDATTSTPGGQSAGITIGAEVRPKSRDLALIAEVDLPTTTTHEDYGTLKSGPVTYVVSQKHWVVSALVAQGIRLSGTVSLRPAIGVALVGISPDVRYSYRPLEATQQQHFAWVGGLGLRVRRHHLLVDAPTVRVRFLTGTKDEAIVFRPTPFIWSIGANVGWSF